MSNKESTNIIAAACTILGAMVLAPAIMLIGSLIGGYTVATLWGWFIAPIFGLKELSIVQAIGLSLVVTYMTYQTAPEDTESTSTKLKIAKELLRPVFALMIGYVVHRWFM